MAWQPHPGPQEDFCSRGEYEVLYGGAAGGGKSDALIWEAARDVEHPRYKGLLLRRTFPQLQEIIDRCWEYYPQIGGVYRAGEHRWYFPSGATVTLGHMQHEQDMYNYHGKEFQFVGFDEVTRFTEEQYLYMFSRARSAFEGIRCRFRSTTNPGGPGHLWVKMRFVDAAKPGETFIDPDTGLSRVFIPAKVTDNPTLMEFDPGYIARLEALPELDRKRQLDGDWEVFEGQAFPELNSVDHSCDPFEIPVDWEKFMVFDWGYAAPFSCGWYAMDYDGTMIRYREWYGCKTGERNAGLMMIAGDVAKGILEREAPGEIKTRYADPSIFKKLPKYRSREAIGPDIAGDMAAVGVHFMEANNHREHGKQQVHKRLGLIEKINQHGDVEERLSRFRAFNDQEHFWRVMTSLQQHPTKPEDVNDKMEDHAYDEFRYACAKYPVLPTKVERIEPHSFSATRRRYINAKKYAQRHGVSMAEAYMRVR